MTFSVAMTIAHDTAKSLRNHENAAFDGGVDRRRDDGQVAADER
jgi:hypothetical protein